MPYLVGKDKTDLNPLIENLRATVVVLSARHDNMMVVASWGYKHYIARRVLVDTALNAAEQYQGKRATRYWLLVDHAGIALNIGLELYRRVLVHRPSGHKVTLRFLNPEDLPGIPADAQELDAEIDALIQEIAKIGGPTGYNYDGAYCGMDNYSLTELLPRVLLSVLEANSVDIDWDHIESLVLFWLTMALELYADVAHPYEDQQVEKNGDVAIYDLLLKRLKDKEQ